MTNATTNTDKMLPLAEAKDKAYDLVVEFGSMLDEKDEWDLDDNFDTTEALYDLYMRIVGQR